MPIHSLSKCFLRIKTKHIKGLDGLDVGDESTSGWWGEENYNIVL